MEIRCSTGVTFRQGQAYVETHAKTDMGVYMIVAPIYTISLSVVELTDTLERVFKAGNKIIPHPTPEEKKRMPSALLKAAKVGSWKKLAQGSAAYSIKWGSEEVLLYMSKLDEKGRYVWDPAKTRRFRNDISFKEIAHTILDDVHSRPELRIIE